MVPNFLKNDEPQIENKNYCWLIRYQKDKTLSFWKEPSHDCSFLFFMVLMSQFKYIKRAYEEDWKSILQILL